ncbi:dehydroshikimate dehydratase QsuB [Alpinimonas psychrophila]|uniref:3-dehydroshikimate dehydratase n=1 Tax=Alpinimonas psychrophila TaxID=748908 RepID=A0A7W3JTC3_9MICO|nr:sugar phosphate isomerase/epimerase and 4-hydroxyphenylpyruvate domain-containing protein [Alpinimonas psychrophila]MBA8828863.1 4-hydroxyphenylpyruvate dioxygenase [Alpinimonas psychrophila]
MKTSIATVSIGGSLREKLVAISRAGFDGYEIFENDLISSPMSPEDIRSLSDDLGLTIDLYQPFRDFEGVSESQLARNLKRAAAKFDVMKRLGVDTILACSNVGTAIDPSDQLAIDQLGKLSEMAEFFDVKIAYEALAWGKFVSTYDHSWSIVQAVNHASLGLCLDSFHILSRGSSLDKIAEIPGDKIFFVQLADAPLMSLDVLTWSRHYRLFPGEGAWDLPAFVLAAISAGYSGPLSLEIFNDTYRQGAPTLTARDGHRSLKTLEDETIGISSSHSQTSFKNLDPLPLLQVPRGFSFVELQPGEGDQLVKVLSALGFELAGAHRRKAVELWTQGDARIVINNDLTGTQAELVGVGVEVADIDTLTERARSLKARLKPRDIESGEEELVAVEAPNNIDFYFGELTGVNPKWSSEFASLNSKSSQETALTHIDHIALRQPWQRIDESVLFFRSIFGLEIDDGQDIASEFGLVRSRSLVNKDRTIRLALNVTPTGADGRQTFSDHIALSTVDILKTAKLLRSNGLHVLRVPQNYYEDLTSKFEIDKDRLKEMQDFDVLFDSNEDGNFFHFYTQPIGSLFFEIIQRVDGYDGYGASNAFVRLSSQRAIDVKGLVK